MSRGAWLPLVSLALAFALAPGAQAAEQPREAPAEFRNGQETAFGRITMEPYVDAREGGAVPVAASLMLRDMGALARAQSVMLALSLHEREADLTVDGVFDAEGRALPVEKTGTDGKGLQAQVFVSASELRGRAVDGEVPLTFRGQADPKGTGQVHVGVLVVAYDGDWAEVQSADGPAKLYGYSLLQSAGGGLMPFNGQGNTMMVVPIAVLALFGLVAGGMAVRVLRFEAMPIPMPSRPVPVFGAPARPPVATQTASATPAPAPPRVVLGTTEIELAPEVPVFGSAVSPVLGKPTAAPPPASPAPEPFPFPIPTGPVQGPHLPPHWPKPSAQADDEAKPEALPAPVAGAKGGAEPKAPKAAGARRPKRPASSGRRAPRRKAPAQPSR